MKLSSPALGVLLLLGGCGSSLPGTPVSPPLPAETIPLPPVSEERLIWHPGDWAYSGGSYRYDAGHYEPAGSHGTLWTAGHWTGARGDYAWVPGAWN